MDDTRITFNPTENWDDRLYRDMQTAFAGNTVEVMAVYRQFQNKQMFAMELILRGQRIGSMLYGFQTDGTDKILVCNALAADHNPGVDILMFADNALDEMARLWRCDVIRFWTRRVGFARRAVRQGWGQSILLERRTDGRQ